jgi:hypothetical protein
MEKGHAGGCCGKKGGVLADWRYVDKNVLNSGRADIMVEGKATAVSVRDIHGFLGDENPGEFNENPYVENDEELTLVHFNRRRLIELIRSDDQPPFKVGGRARNGPPNRLAQLGQCPLPLG